MDIPADVEAVIKDRANQRVMEAEASMTVISPEKFGTETLLACVLRTEKLAAQLLEKASPEEAKMIATKQHNLFLPVTNRVGAGLFSSYTVTRNGVTKHMSGNYISRRAEVLTCWEKITEWEHDQDYCGADADEVLILRGRVPADYTVCLPFIRIGDLPAQLLEKGQDGSTRIGYALTSSEEPVGYFVAESIRPYDVRKPIFWHDETGQRKLHMDAEQLFDIYGWFSFKITRDGIVKHWNPGLDTKYAPVNPPREGQDPLLEFMDQQFVLLGIPYQPR